MSNFVIGTAGHVDHGKTTLIRALTGIDTDRLKEEKEREMSIELGFAYLDLPQVGRVGIVDVPGHERFLKNMLRGATGVDIVLLVVAADEGVMPQTRDHLAILNLLGIKSGLVVITKMDLAEEGMLELVMDECRELVEDTFLKGCSIIPVSASSGANLAQLKEELGEIVTKTSAKREDIPFRLPIDRVFSMKGSGTVITGTVTSGRVGLGEMVEIMPGGGEARVRAIQIHSQVGEEAVAGQRAAFNLARIGRSEIGPGDVISRVGYLKPSTLIDSRLNLLPGVREIKNWNRVRIHAGATEVLARVSILEGNVLKSNQSGFVQLNLESPLAMKRGDPFVLRFYSPMNLLGGGVVLDPFPPKHKRGDQDLLDRLGALEQGDIKAVLEKTLLKTPVALDDLGKDLDHPDVGKYIKEMSSDVASFGKYVLHRKLLEKIENELKTILTDFNNDHPLRTGIPKEELKGKLKNLPFTRETKVDLNRFWDEALGGIPSIELKGEFVKLKGKRIEFSAEQAKMKDEIENIFLSSSFSPPSLGQIKDKYNSSNTSDIIRILLDSSVLVRVSSEIMIHQGTLEAAKKTIKNLVDKGGDFSVSQFRSAAATTRKFAVPILEYLDGIRYTKRVGDVRVLAEKDSK